MKDALWGSKPTTAEQAARDGRRESAPKAWRAARDAHPCERPESGSQRRTVKREIVDRDEILSMKGALEVQK